MVKILGDQPRDHGLEHDSGYNQVFTSDSRADEHRERFFYSSSNTLLTSLLKYI